MTINVTEKIRKMMGWCPNENVLASRKTVQFDDMIVAVPDGSGNIPHKNIGWWSRYQNRVFIISFFIMPLATIGMYAISIFFFYGRFIPEAALIGIILGLIFGICQRVYGFCNYRIGIRYDAGKTIKQQPKRKTIIIDTMIGVISAFVIIALIQLGGIHFGELYAFLLGMNLFYLAHYLEVVYWERKNRKMLIVEKKSFYAVDTEQVSVT